MSELDTFLQDIAIYGSIGGVAIVMIKSRYPKYWNMIFPSKEEQLQAHLELLKAKEKQSKERKLLLEKIRDTKDNIKIVNAQITVLEKEVGKLE